MAKVIAVNNIKAKCGNLPFKECSVVFRNGNTSSNEKLLLSDLIKPSFVNHKGSVICYCSGINKIKVEEEIIEEKEDVELEDVFAQYGIVEKMDLEEDMEQLYQKEKISWINRFSKNQNLIEAVKADYACDEQYCQERLSQEYPGFFIVDESTIFYKSKYPSKRALDLEKRISLQINGSKAKYGTFVRIVELEAHDHEDFNDTECIVIFNYLLKFDIVGLLCVVERDLDGKQFESIGSRS